MRQMLIVIWTVLISDTLCGDSCYCGFGGACRFHPDTHVPVPTDCSRCKDVSKGLYKNCDELADNCDSSPCLNGGVCIMTFGGFTCTCPKAFYGHLCENRRKKSEKFEVVSGPRVWYQVNRVWGGLTERNQIINFAVESPGDGMVAQIRFVDGRLIEILDTDLRPSNEKQKCLTEVKKWPKSSDPNICETLPDKMVYSTTINVAFFDDRQTTDEQYGLVTAQVNGENVTEGRLDDIHITILNWKRITYSQYYRIHSVFDIWPKCLYEIGFVGCSVNRQTPTVHAGQGAIYLKSIRIPKNYCGAVKEMKWYMRKRGNQPFLTRPDREHVYIAASELLPGLHYIDFLMTVEGRPQHHGHPDLSYNYGRCWIKVVDGEFKVGIEGGNSRAVLCIKPLTLRIFSYNKNFIQKDFASIWKCHIDGLEVCERQRFLGPKIFFRTLPCGITITFTAMAVDVPTGSKTFLTVTVKTTTHVDSLICSCTHNCYPSIHPLSTTKMSVELKRLSSAAGPFDIKWTAKFAGESWGIERFIIPETLGTAIEIPPRTFEQLTEEQTANPHIEITASKHDLYCTISVDISVPMKKPTVAMSTGPEYVDDVNDERYSVFILEHPVLNNDLPISYIISEAISPNSTEKEIIEFITGDVQRFSYVKMANPSYVTRINHMGVRSPELMIPKRTRRPEPSNDKAIKETIKLIRKLARNGNDNVALTEMVYISRTIVMSVNQNYYHKKKIIEIMNNIVNGFDRSVSSLVVSARLNKVLNTMNRLTLISNLTQPPFNVSVHPWKLPPLYKHTVMNWIDVYVVASETLHTVTKYYYYFVSRKDTTATDVQLLQLMFESLLRLQFAQINLQGVLHKMASTPILMFRKKTESARMKEFMQRTITLLLKSMDFHIDGHTGRMDISIGTTTASASVMPLHSVAEWSRRMILNEFQHIQLKATVHDRSLSLDDSVFLGVFVEVPQTGQLTTRVHTLLSTHLTQRDVNATIEVQLNVTCDRDPYQFSILGIPGSRQERSVNVFKFELDSEPDVLHDQIVRQVVIHYETNQSLRVALASYVPQYAEVALAPSASHLKLIKIVDFNDTFMGVLPGSERTEVPITFKLSMMQFICIQKLYPDPADMNIRDSKTVCGMEQTAVQDNEQVTCSCNGSGMIETYKLGLKVVRIMSDFNFNPDARNDYIPDANDFFILAYPGLILLLIIFGWWRDKKTRKREFIQRLSDTFPDDRFAYIVGVRTGKRAWAGTNARVGMQIFGSVSASRVHILQSNSYKVLGRGQEDWFAVFTPDRLGKLNYLLLWHDYGNPFPDWYCSQILVYDVEHQVWFRFVVEKWLTVSDDVDKSRLVVVRSRKYIPEKELAEKFTFSRHYWRELENTHSLFSPLTKHPRYVHSYRMRACLALTFVLTLVSLAIYGDYYCRSVGYDLDYGNVFLISFISTIIASIPFTIISFFFTRSILKMKRTKMLDLQWVVQVKSLWEIGSDYAEVSANPALSERHDSNVEFMSTQYKTPKKSVNKSGTQRIKAKKGSQFSTASISVAMHKWLSSSLYRPIRFDDYGFWRIEIFSYVSGWVLLSVTIAANMIFLITWFTRIGWLVGRNGILVVTIALAFEVIRSSLMVLLLSLHSVYFHKRCNLEISCLDLTGLQNEAKIHDHAKFIAALTKPYYHPLTADAILVEYKKKMKRMMYIKIFGILLLIIGMVLTSLVLSELEESVSVHRILQWTKDIYSEPVKNNYTTHLTLFKNAHTLKDLTSYMLGTLLPVARVFKWYNNKVIRSESDDPKKTKFFFVDRSTRVSGTTTVRVLQARNDTKTYLANVFRDLDVPIFSTAYGQFDQFAKYRTTYNRWNQVTKRTESNVILDILLSNGLEGVTGFFYPASIGDEISIQEEVESDDERIDLVLKHLIKKWSRAIIFDISLVHLLFSPAAYSAMVGYSIVKILFENCATGLYTGSLSATFFYDKTANNYLYLGCILCGLSLLCMAPIVLMMFHNGLKACWKSFLFWVLILECVFCWIAAASEFAIHVQIRNQGHRTGTSIASEVNYHTIVWLKNLNDGASGTFVLLATVSWTIWWSQLTGIIKGRQVESNSCRLLAVFGVYFFMTFCFGLMYENKQEHGLLEVERIDKRHVMLNEMIAFVFVIFSRTILWPLQMGVVMSVAMTCWKHHQVRGVPTDKKLVAAHYNEHSRKKLPRGDVYQNYNKSNREMIGDRNSDESVSRTVRSTSNPSLDSVQNPTARLSNKFNLWK